MTHGGAREGAGRKPSPTPTKLRVNVTLSPEALAELQRQATEAEVSQSAQLEALIWERAGKRK